MSDNRGYIDERTLVKREQILEKGIPIIGLAGKYQVKEGFCAVLAEGGVYKETLGPGFYYLHKYKFFRDLTATVVDMRTKTLNIETDRKHQIKYPFPVEIDLYLTIEYKVVDPRRVALEYEEPLHLLFDRVTAAFDPIISNANYEEVQTRRAEISQKILQQLKAMQLSIDLGIDVRNCTITTLKIHDTGSDVISTRARDESNYLRDAQMQAFVLQNSPRDFMSIIMQADPNERVKLMQTLAEQGLLLGEGQLLNSPANMFGGGQQATMAGQLGAGFGMQQGYTGSQTGMGSLQQMLPGQTTGQNRMVSEINYLRSIPGANVETIAEKDANGLATGAHKFRVTVPKQSGGTITSYFRCSAQFPTEPPLFSLEVDGQDYPFNPSCLRNWRGNYLYEIVQEIINGVG